MVMNVKRVLSAVAYAWMDNARMEMNYLNRVIMSHCAQPTQSSTCMYGNDC